MEILEEREAVVDRVIMDLRSDKPGPTLLVIGGIHGNEPSGVFALEQIAEHFKEHNLSLDRGRLIAFRGNRRALSEKTRFIKRDLNRMWLWDFKHQCPIDPTTPEPDDEYDEYCDLQFRIHQAIKERTGPICFLDLHTTSAESAPFIMIGDTLRNRDLVQGIPVPIVFGVEEELDGPLLSYINELGHLSVGFEAGKHDAPEAIDAHAALTWVIAHRLGLINDETQTPIDQSLIKLAELGAHLKNFYEVRYRHGIDSSDDFSMRLGFKNFQVVRKKEVIADDKKGPIQMPENGRIFMPLYQKKGNDGFFQIRRIAPFWLAFSRKLRMWKAYKLIGLLPGVRKEGNPLLLKVNTSVARWYPRQIFHLLGYRKIRMSGAFLYMEKRPFDFEEPPLQSF